MSQTRPGRRPWEPVTTSACDEPSGGRPGGLQHLSLLTLSFLFAVFQEFDRLRL